MFNDILNYSSTRLMVRFLLKNKRPIHFNIGDKHFQRSVDFANADTEIRREKKKRNKTSIVNDLVGQ